MLGALKKIGPGLFFAVACVFGGAVLVRDVAHAPEAEASTIPEMAIGSYVGGGFICGTGTGGAVCTASPTLTGTLTAAGISAVTGVFSAGVSAVTGVFSSTLDVAGAVGITGAVTARAGVTITQSTTNGNALAATGNGTGKGGVFTGGGTDGGGNNGTPGVQGTGGSAGGNGGFFTGTGVYAGVWAEQTGNGRALVVSGDTTSPQKAQMYMIPTDGDPSGANLVGDLYMFTTGVLRSCVTAGTGSAAVFRSVANSGIRASVAAAGSVQSNATAINGLSDFYQATGADGTKGIALNVGTANQCTRIMNQSASVLKVWPNNADNDQINALGTDLAYSQAAGTSLVYCTADGTNWLTY